MNLISGPCGKGVYINGAMDCEISDNVGENAGGDFMHHGWGHRNKFYRNWDARRYYPTWDSSTGWDHGDFIQLYSGGSVGVDLEVVGNVHMVMGGAGVPGSLCSRGSHCSAAVLGSGWIFTTTSSARTAFTASRPSPG